MNEIFHFINDITIKDVLLLLLGTVLGFLTNIVSSALYPKMQIRYKRWLQQRWARGHTQLESSLFTSDKLVIAEQMINVIILARGQFGSEKIQCSYDYRTWKLAPEFEHMKKALMQDLEQKRKGGETRLPYNSTTYKLLAFNHGLTGSIPAF